MYYNIFKIKLIKRKIIIVIWIQEIIIIATKIDIKTIKISIIIQEGKIIIIEKTIKNK